MLSPYSGFTINGDTGKIISHAEVRITLAGTSTLAQLFSDKAGQHAIENPTQSSPDGQLTFFALPATYDFFITGTNVQPQLIRNILLPIDPSDSQAPVTQDQLNAKSINDWLAEPGQPGFINNKPTIPTVVKPSWTAQPGSPAEILNKPDVVSQTQFAQLYTDFTDFVAVAAQSVNGRTVDQFGNINLQIDWQAPAGQPGFINNKPTIPTVVKPDWNAPQNSSAEILNKPEIVSAADFDALSTAFDDYLSHAVRSVNGVGPGQNGDISITIAKPTAYNKKIVVLGSSVANGTGASNGNSWVSLLSTALTAQGYQVVNKSVGGDNTTAARARVYTQVMTQNPAIVIIGLSLANEGLVNLSGQESTYESFIRGINALIDMFKQAGVDVILGGVYPQNVYTENEYYYLKLADSHLSRIDGVPYIPFLGSVDDGSGHWRGGMFADDGHPNDNGHRAMARTFDVSLFNHLRRYKRINITGTPAKIVTPVTSGVIPFNYTAPSVFGSLTVMFKVRRGETADAGKPICTLVGSYSAAPIRIRNNVDQWVVSAGVADVNQINSLIYSSDHVERWMALTFDHYTKRVTFYIDNTPIGFYDYTDCGEITGICFAGRPDALDFSMPGYEFSHFMIWRTALRLEQIKSATQGDIFNGGLVVCSPITDGLAKNGARLTNLAASDGGIILGVTPAAII